MDSLPAYNSSCALLVRKNADKLTLGQSLTIGTSHALEGVLKQPLDRWLSNARMTHYQTPLLNPARITSQVPTALNLATLLPDSDLEAPLHDCPRILAQVHCVCSNLRDTPLPDAEVTWYTNGSSFVQNEQRCAGAAVTMSEEVVWAEAMPAGTSAQRTELVALTKVLELEQGRKINIYTDSCYAFATTHVSGANI